MLWFFAACEDLLRDGSVGGRGRDFFYFFYRFTILPQHLVAKELAGKITLEPHIFLEQH